jgi:hypothetical protein
MDEETEAKKSQEISSNITKIMAEPRLEFWVYDSNIYPVDLLLLLLLLSSSPFFFFLLLFLLLLPFLFPLFLFLLFCWKEPRPCAL